MLVFYTDIQYFTEALTVRESSPSEDMCGYLHLQGLQPLVRIKKGLREAPESMSAQRRDYS